MTPDGAIRKAIAEALAARNIPCFDGVVPISKATPDSFVQIGAQGRSRTAVTKQNYEWMGECTLTLVKVNEKGYISSVELDAMDSAVCAVMDNLSVDGFRVALTRFLGSDSDNLESPADTICRRHIRFEIWINRIL